MDLILWRHAEAEDPGGVDDLERALTRKGQRQAKRVGEWLGGRLAATTRIVASPALRCRQTAEALQLEFKTLEALAPGASADDILAAVRWPDAGEPVLVVGHQPTLGAVAAQLLGGGQTSWNVKKAGVWWLRGEPGEGALRVTLRAVIAPDLL